MLMRNLTGSNVGPSEPDTQPESGCMSRGRESAYGDLKIFDNEDWRGEKETMVTKELPGK